MITQEAIDKKIERVQEEINLAEKCMTELEQRKQELKELVESLKAVEAEQNSRAKHGGLYWYIDDINQIISATECNSLSDNYRYETGNYYLTPEDAEKAEKQILLFRLLDRFSRQNGWTDEVWEDDETDKWYIWYDQPEQNLGVGFANHPRDICQVYFTSKAIAQQAIDKYPDLIVEVMGI